MVSQSIWPLFLSLGLIFFAIASVAMFYRVPGSGWALVSAFFFTTAVIFFWFRDMIHEAHAGFHNKWVLRGLRIGFILFVISEAMLFFSFFWAYFHSSFSPSPFIGGVWPPPGIVPPNPFSLPLVNTLLLLTSSLMVTMAHRILPRVRTRNMPFAVGGHELSTPPSSPTQDPQSLGEPSPYDLSQLREIYLTTTKEFKNYARLSLDVRLSLSRLRFHLVSLHPAKRRLRDRAIDRFSKLGLRWPYMHAPRDYFEDRFVMGLENFLRQCALLGVTLKRTALGIPRICTALEFVFWLFLACAFGGLFLLLQYREYLGNSFSINDSVYGSCFYFLTGLHGLHVALGLFSLLALLLYFIRKFHLYRLPFFFRSAGPPHFSRFPGLAAAYDDLGVTGEGLPAVPEEVPSLYPLVSCWWDYFLENRYKFSFFFFHATRSHHISNKITWKNLEVLIGPSGEEFRTLDDDRSQRIRYFTLRDVFIESFAVPHAGGLFRFPVKYFAGFSNPPCFTTSSGQFLHSIVPGEFEFDMETFLTPPFLTLESILYHSPYGSIPVHYETPLGPLDFNAKPDITIMRFGLPVSYGSAFFPIIARAYPHFIRLTAPISEKTYIINIFSEPQTVYLAPGITLNYVGTDFIVEKRPNQASPKEVFPELGEAPALVENDLELFKAIKWFVEGPRHRSTLFDYAVWYWHFVDFIWLLLYLLIYCPPYL